jgi:hypothetical protein
MPRFLVVSIFFAALFIHPFTSHAQVRELKEAPAAAKQVLAEQKAAVQAKGRWLYKTRKQEGKNRYSTALQEGKDQVRESVQNRLNLLKILYDPEKDTLGRLRIPPPVRIASGSASLTQQVGRRQGVYPAMSPPTFTQFSFNGSVEAFGLPLTVHSLYSTAQTDGRQPMNRTGVSIDGEALKARLRGRIEERIAALEKITNPSELKDLEQLTDFYRNNHLKTGSTRELEALLRDVTPDDPAGKLKEKARSTLRQHRQGLRDSADRFYASHQERMARQLDQKVRKRLASGEIDTTALKRLQQKWDSLGRVDPERLLRYADITTLKALRDGKLSPQEGVATLRRLGVLSKGEALLGSIRSFGVGTSYPTYSQYTLRGLPISGFHAELQPGRFYLAYAASKNLSAVPEQRTYARNLQAGRLGVGKPEGNHLFATFLYGRDNKNSFRGDTLIAGVMDTSFYDKPRQNAVLAAQLGLKLKSYLALEGELARSLTAMNTYAEDFSSVPVPALLLRGAADSSLFRSGQAANLKLKGKLGKSTSLTLKAEQIGAGFYSLGAPYLRNDIRGYELKADHTLFKRQVTLSPYYGEWHDNLSGSRRTTTRMDAYGATVKVTPRKMPYLVVHYTRNDMESSLETNRMRGLNLTAGYGYKLGQMQAQTNLSLARQGNHSSNPESALNASISNLTYTQLLTFSFPVSLSGTLSLLDATGIPQSGKWVTYGGTAGYTFRTRWQSSIGFMQGQNQGTGRRQAHYAESRLNLGRYGAIALRVEKNLFRVGDPERDYDELLGSLTLTGRF